MPRSGDLATQALTSVAGIEAFWQSSFNFSTSGLQAGAYDAVMLDPTGVELTRTRFFVVAKDGAASLGVPTLTIKTGEGINVVWTGAPGMRFDWIGIYHRADPDLDYYLPSGVAPMMTGIHSASGSIRA